MKFTLGWLKDHLITDASVAEIADALTDLGLEVETLEDPAALLEPFTLGRVISAQPHPGADRLTLCHVDTGEGTKPIVCGAPNARADIVVVVAAPGDYIPGSGITIKASKIRGIESRGMICSERELGLGDEHDGIIELSDGTPGTRLVDWLAANDPDRIDPCLDIAVTPNRPDALGIRGIARDLSARGLGELKVLSPAVVHAAADQPAARVSIDSDARDGCPMFCTRVIRGISNGPSPAWIQNRLRAVGLRPINLLVDITNFMTLDCNRPLHVFDADRLDGALRVHRAEGGEQITALDGNTYVMAAGQMLISDARAPQSIAGIMGGEASGCSSNTTNVVVESALWDPVEIAHAGRALKIHSDARQRFERGVDPAFVCEGLDRAVQMMTAHGGGQVSAMFVAGEEPQTRRTVPLRPQRLQSLVGLDVTESEQHRILEALGFDFDGEEWGIPPWRPDIDGEADLVEELARVVSLSRLQSRPLPRPAGVTRQVLNSLQRCEARARRECAALGYNECVSYSFVDGKAARLFGGGGRETRLANPISVAMCDLRPSLLPGLLQAVARNQSRGTTRIALFEVGHTFSGGEPGEQQLEVAGVLAGMTGRRNPHAAARAVDLFDVKADALVLLKSMQAPDAQLGRDAEDWWHPARHGRFTLGPQRVLGVFGELHPRILQEFDVEAPAVAFTLWPERIPAPKRRHLTRVAPILSDMQAAERDFAFVVDRGVEARMVLRAVRAADGDVISDVWIFDEFVPGGQDQQGATGIGEGQKSIAITVKLQPDRQNLTDSDIAAISRRLIERVVRSTGGRLR